MRKVQGSIDFAESDTATDGVCAALELSLLLHAEVATHARASIAGEKHGFMIQSPGGDSPAI